MPEHQTIEWKESWHDEYLEWICGYANAHGGILYIGKNDAGKVVGIQKSKKLLEVIPSKMCIRDRFGFCPCPMLAEVDRLETDTWCQCTTGYSKVLFETAFSCRADVELLKSIKMGNDVCLMKITLHNPCLLYTSRTGHAGYNGHDSQRNVCIHMLQIVKAGITYGQAARRTPGRKLQRQGLAHGLSR